LLAKGLPSAVQTWLQEMIALCQPEKVHLCDGSEGEYNALLQEMVAKGTFLPLSPDKRPRSFLARSHPDDVARVEECTFICSQSKEDAGPTNNWSDPQLMHARLKGLFQGCMRGRTLYIIPFCMGTPGFPAARLGIQVTDSPYVVCHMRIMTSMGETILPLLEKASFVPCVHSVGVPLTSGVKDTAWPCNPEKRVIAHFPEEPSIWSFGSGYGGNALLGKKCLALRIASAMGRKEGWLAEHMLILGIENPEGKKRYFAAAFPSACGKTNLAMVRSLLPGWKISCVGDDIAWIHIGEDGRWYACNPEAGMFGVAPGTSAVSNPSAMEAIASDTLFTNVALTDKGDVWWEGMTKESPAHLTDWQGRSWTPASGIKASHPNARFTVPIRRCPVFDPTGIQKGAVPLSAILFGGRQPTRVPLVCEARSFAHGVLMGAALSSQTTAAAKGKEGVVRHDPFAMLPFCGYHMGDYFAHWLDMGARTKPPRIFQVNWFLQDAGGKILWPGFSDNVRVLKWIFERLDDVHLGKELPIGIVPASGELDLSGLSLPASALEQLVAYNPAAWKKEAEELTRYFAQFAPHFPAALQQELDHLQQS